MADLWLTGDHSVDKLSIMSEPIRPTQPPIPHGVNENYPCNCIKYSGGSHKTADQGCAWLFSCRSKSVGAGLDYAAYRLYVRSVCDTKAPLQLRLVVLYKCYMPLPSINHQTGNFWWIFRTVQHASISIRQTRRAAFGTDHHALKIVKPIIRRQNNAYSDHKVNVFTLQIIDFITAQIQFRTALFVYNCTPYSSSH